MNFKSSYAVACCAALLCSAGARAQENIVKVGITDYTTHSRTNGISGIGVPPGADAESGSAVTLLLVYERLIDAHIGFELAVGIPPRIKSKATGTVAFLGDDVLSAKNVAPTVFVNYHFGEPGQTLRPYLGAGINYTRFASVKSKLASDVKLGDSTGLALQAGLDYALSKEWSLFASVAALKVKSKLVASGTTVLQTTIDFRPIVYSFGTVYHF